MIRKNYYYNHSNTILYLESIHTHTIIKSPSEFSEILTSDHWFLNWQRLSLKEISPGSSQVTLRSVPLGVHGCSPLQTSRAQSAFLGTTVYRFSRWLTLGINIFHPSLDPHDVGSNWAEPALQVKRCAPLPILHFAARCHFEHSGANVRAWGCMCDRVTGQVCLVSWVAGQTIDSAVGGLFLLPDLEL